MNLIIIIFGVLGILISLINFFNAERYIAAQMCFVTPQTVWQLNTMPTLSTILLFTTKHWIFTIGILLPIIQMFIPQLGPMFGFLGRILLVIGTSIVITLSLTSQETHSTNLFSWWFPVLIAVSFFGTWLANKSYRFLIGIFVRFPM